MANVPYTPYASVEPTMNGMGASPISVDAANPAAFGAGIGTVMEGAGEKVTKLADHFQNLYAESTARDATTKTAQDMGDAEARFHQLKGNAAVAGLKPFQDEIAAIAKNNSNGLSLNANEMYQRDSAGLVNGATFRAGAHVGEQAEAAQKDSLNASLATNVNQFAMNATNPTGASYLQKIQDDALSYSHFMGVTDPNVADQVVSHNYGEAFGAAIRTNLQSDPDAAQKLWEQAKNGLITKPDGSTVPYLDAAHRASIASEMQGEFKKQAQNTLWDAGSLAAAGDVYNKDAVTSSMLRAGYSQYDVAAHIQHLDNVQSSFGSANARYDLDQTLKNNTSLAWSGKDPTPIDSNLAYKAFPKEPDKAQAVLEQYAVQQKLAGIMRGVSTRTPQENAEQVASFAPTASSVGSSLYNLGNVKTAAGAAGNTPDFVNPSTPTDGVILAANNLRKNYQGLTLQQIGAKWTGEPDKVASWVAAASQHSGIAPDAVPNLNDPVQLQSVLKGMNIAENSASKASYFSDDVIAKGVDSSLSGKNAETSKGGAQNYTQQSELHDQVQAAMQDYYKRLNSDPAGVITGNDIKLNSMYQDAATDAKNPQKMVDYVNAVSARQEALQVPEKYRSVLPQSYATSITDKLMANPETSPAQLAKMANDYGSAWPSVFKSLVQQGGMPPAYQIIQQLGSDPMTEKYGSMLARYMGSEETKGKTDEVLMGGSAPLKELNNTVSGGLTDLTLSLARSGSSPEQISATIGSAQKLAMAIHFYDPNNNDPAGTAIRSLISKYAYLPSGGARVPADRYDIVQNSTQAVLDGVEDLMSPAQFVPNTYANRQQYIDDLKSNPTWITRGAENKVELYDQEGRAVLGKDGKPLSVRFDDAPIKSKIFHEPSLLDVVSGKADTLSNANGGE